MELCARGGIVDFLAVEASIDPEVMDWWLAFDSIWPIGERRADHRTAVQTSWIWAAMTGEARSPDEFRCISTEIPSAPEDLDEDPEADAMRDLAEQAQFL